jgi:hypothetical protein
MVILRPTKCLLLELHLIFPISLAATYSNAGQQLASMSCSKELGAEAVVDLRRRRPEASHGPAATYTT